MSRIEICLSDTARAFIEEQVAQGQYPDTSAYLEALVDEARRKQAETEEIDAKLLEALAGPPATPLTPEFWHELEREARRRQAAG